MRLDEILIGEKTTDGRIDFREHISRVREEASNWLEGNDKNGVEHSKRLEGYLDRLIPDEFKKKLKPAEVFILLYAVYLHDIGYRKDDGSIEPEDHAKRSKEKILKEPATYLFGNFPSRGSDPPSAAKAVATVCYGHAPESIYPLDSINDKFPDHYLCSETLNLRLLVALLRLADEMDQPYMRLGHFRKHISLVEIGTDIVRWYWEDLGENAGADLEKQVQKTKEALRAANNYLYPWGNEFDKDKCNIDESGIDHTTPVKKYQEGRSTYGCLDMAGNVREWTDSWYDKKEESRVVRGGEWFSSRYFARCACRHMDFPGTGNYFTGFRCASTL